MEFFEATGLDAWYQSAEEALNDAFDNARGRHSVSRSDRHLIAAASIGRMLAVNMRSRELIARHLCDGIADKLCINEHWEHDRPAFLLTIIPKAGIVDSTLRGFDPSGITNRLRINLRGLDHLSIVEPGYFASFHPSNCILGKQAVSWHVHTLLWNLRISDVGALLDKLGKLDAFGAVLREMPAVHARQVNNGDLPAVVRYILKPPSKAKRIQRYPWIRGGAIVRYANGSTKFYTKTLSADLQKSERLRLFHAMKHLTLDQLIVGGGEGKFVRANALNALDHELTERMSA